MKDEHFILPHNPFESGQHVGTFDHLIIWSFGSFEIRNSFDSGLYDMHGNVCECCVQDKKSRRAGNPAFSQTGGIPNCEKKPGFLPQSFFFVLYTDVNDEIRNPFVQVRLHDMYGNVCECWNPQSL